MANIIHIKEEELVRLIIDAIDDWMNKNELGREWSVKEETQYQLFRRGLVTEMAFRRKDFIDHIKALKHQLIENWSLLMYCKLYDKENQNFYHWMGEFTAHANNIKEGSLKDGSNKKKVISQVYIGCLELNKPKTIERIIKAKFNKEGIEQKYVKPISQACANLSIDLVEFLADDNYTTQDYIANTFEN